MRFYDKGKNQGLAFDEPKVEKTGVGTITRQEKPKKEKENTADADRKADDAFMAQAEPSDIRGTESGAYDGIDTSQMNYRKEEDVY